MRQLLPCLPLALLFLASAVPSNGQKQVVEQVVEVVEGAPLVVECALRPEQRAEWRVDGGAVRGDLRAGERGAGGRVTARLAAARAAPAHAGIYTCAPDSPPVRVRVRSLATGVGTEATPAEVGAELDAGDITYFEWRGNFSLNCSSLAAPGATIVWKKDDRVVEEIPELKGHVLIQATGGVARGQLTLAGRARDQDAGNYTCEAGPASRTWQVHARPVAKMSPDTNVVEGQKLKLTCKILGLPLPAVKWYYSNESAEDKNASEVTMLFGERVELSASEQGVAGGELVVGAARSEDAGWFRCEPQVPRAVPAVTRLRVKDMYAALWPFLGICAEVFILCAIILVYEKRRTKPELDDSDTDNHDQKKS